MEEDKLISLLDSLSWIEKVGQLIQLSGEFFDSSALVVGPQAKLGISDEMLKNVGSVLNVVGARKTREIQTKYLDESEHKIPLLFMADIIYGYRTIFPIPLGLGATWNPELIEEVYTLIGKESKAGGAHVTFAPMVDLVRDARWGRCLESTGEDSLLNARYAEAMVNGIQKNIAENQGIASCVKHFAAYGAAEAGREYNTVDMSERRLRQDYLSGYKAAIDAGCKLVMTSFNTFDGVPATANQFLLKTILRDEWGFEGVVISDYAAIRELIDYGLAKDNKEAALLAITATTDIDMKSPCFANELENLVKNGEIDGELIDQAVWRVVKLKNDLGLFEDPYRGADESSEKNAVLNPESRELARKAASESIVLLKNENAALPLRVNEEKVLLVGPYGDNKDLIGLWAVHGKTDDVVTIKEGIEKHLNSGFFKFEKGCDMLENYDFLGEFGSSKDAIGNIKMSVEEEAQSFERARVLAEKADVIIFALGEHTLQSGEAGSRTDIRLPAGQQRFMKALAAMGKKNILISISGRPLVLTEEVDLMDAVIQAWFPGTEGGNAVADILFGEVNPSGRLSVSFPYSVGQLPIYYNELRTGRPLDSDSHKGRFVSKYLDCPNEPLFPFGFGLSYSRMDYSNLTLSDGKMNDKLLVSVWVSNNSDCRCLETVQLYVQDLVGSVARPMKELKKFKKVALEPNQKKEIIFELNREDLKYYTRNMDFTVETGEFVIFIGPNSSETLQEKFILE